MEKIFIKFTALYARKLTLKKKLVRGYTLIETMVSIFIFTLVVMAGMGALLNANLLHQKSQNMRAIMDNLSFVLEDMSRNLRTGYNFHCFVSGDSMPTVATNLTPKSCLNGWAMAFEISNGDPANWNDQWVYSISNTGKVIKATQGPYSASNFIELTPEEVVIDPVLSGFSVIGAEASSTGDTQQPFVTIRLVGQITYKNVITPFSIQTSVSQRLIDVGS